MVDTCTNKISLKFAFVGALVLLIAIFCNLVAATEARAVAVNPSFTDKWNALNGAPGPATAIAQTRLTHEIDESGISVTYTIKYQDFTNGRMYFFSKYGGTFWIHGAILAKYDQLGRENSTLGLPLSDEQDVTGAAGARQNVFENGIIYWGLAVGARSIKSGAIMAKYQAGGGPAVYGLPTADEGAVTGITGAKAQNMQRAILTWDGNNAHPACAVKGAIMDKYIGLGGPAGSYGLALTDEGGVTGVAGARESDFAHGRIYWGPGVGTFSIGEGPILTKYLSAPGGGPAYYGLPTSDLYEVYLYHLPVIRGRAQNMQRAILTWDNTSGGPSYAVTGGIMQKYKILGGPSGPYGMATNDEQNVSGVNGGRESAFQNGKIYWGPGVGAYGMAGDIYNKYLSGGGPATFGLPVTDAYPAWSGWAQNAQGGIFTWSSTLGAHEAHGGVMVKYQMMGGPGGALHLITQEEHGISGVPGSPEAVVANFQNGNVYWALAIGSHAVNGGIYTKYMSFCSPGASDCGPNSPLGLPLTDEFPIPLRGGGMRIQFQHGFITWGALYGTWVDVSWPQQCPGLGTAVDIKNISHNYIISLNIDGHEYLPNRPMAILTNSSQCIPLSAGQHTMSVEKGFWEDNGTRHTLETSSGNFTLQPGEQRDVPINDETVQEFLSNLQTSGYWTGYFFDNNVNYHAVAFRFFSNGTYDYYFDNMVTPFIHGGAYSQVSRSASIITFKVDNSGDNASYDPYNGIFYLKVDYGSESHTVEFTYAGHT